MPKQIQVRLCKCALETNNNNYNKNPEIGDHEVLYYSSINSKRTSFSFYIEKFWFPVWSLFPFSSCDCPPVEIVYFFQYFSYENILEEQQNI